VAVDKKVVTEAVVEKATEKEVVEAEIEKEVAVEEDKLKRGCITSFFYFSLQ